MGGLNTNPAGRGKRTVVRSAAEGRARDLGRVVISHPGILPSTSLRPWAIAPGKTLPGPSRIMAWTMQMSRFLEQTRGQIVEVLSPDLRVFTPAHIRGGGLSRGPGSHEDLRQVRWIRCRQGSLLRERDGGVRHHGARARSIVDGIPVRRRSFRPTAGSVRSSKWESAVTVNVKGLREVGAAHGGNVLHVGRSEVGRVALQQFFGLSILEPQGFPIDIDDILAWFAPHPWDAWRVVNDVTIVRLSAGEPLPSPRAHARRSIEPLCSM